MGANCVGCSSKIKRKPEYERQPEDTLDFNPQRLSYKLQRLFLQVQIDNFEVINYPYDSISIRIKLHEIYESCLPFLRNNKIIGPQSKVDSLGIPSKIKWKFQDKFDFSMDEYQMRKSFITLAIFKSQSIQILQLRLNLYQIVTGPYHHDLALNFLNSSTSRLLFDLKISQKFQILINPLEVYVQLNQQYPAEEFNYSFNAHSCGQQICSGYGSLPSKVSIFSNVQGSYRQLKPEDQCQSPTRIRKDTSLNKMIKNVMKSQLKWNKTDEIVNKASFKETIEILEQQVAMPSFKLSLNSSQISKSSLQFILWNIQFNKAIGNNQAILFTDCYISFLRLLQSDFISLQQLDNDSLQKNTKKIKKKLQIRVCILEQLLLKDGKSIGKIRIKLKIVNQTHFSQLSLHARTEDGVVYMNSMFKIYEGKNKCHLKSQSICKVQASFDKIIGIFYTLGSLSKEKKRNWTQFTATEQRTIKEFKHLINLLTLTIQQSMVLCRKDNLDEIMDKQNTLLCILQRLQIYLNEQDSRFIPEIWKVIMCIIKRGEFYLQNIGFSQFHSQSSSYRSFETSNDTSELNTQKLYPRKLKIALRYQQTMYKILMQSLDYTYQHQKTVIIQAEAYKAYGYFRIPQFRQQVLKCIVHNEQKLEFDEQTIQIFQNEKRIANNLLGFEQKSSSHLHLDWEKYFYNHIRNEKRCDELNSMLLQSFQNNKWFQNLAQKKQSFYIFIQYLAKKMAELGRRLKLIRYQYCPGYNKIVKSFLIQMKKKPLIQYEACTIQTSTVLMANHNLINIIIPIVVEKTNLFDNQSVNQFLNILSTYIKYLTENGTKTLPQKFNHTYFFKIIKMVLQSEYSYAISKMLVIIQTYYEYFNDEFKDVISLYLLSKAFFRLFFHWSFNIRIIFYHLFIIKIYWSKLNGVTQKSNHMDTYNNGNCQIYARYKKLIKILNAAERQKIIKKRNMKKGQKQEYYIKMKRKLNQKKLKQNPQNTKKQKQSESGLDSSSEHQSEKQRIINLARLKTLSELKDGYNRSETLCSNEIKEHLRHIVSNKSESSCSLNLKETAENKMSSKMCQNQKQNFEPMERFSINLKVNRKRLRDVIKSDTDASVKQEIQKLNQEFIKKLSMNSHKLSCTQEKPLVYTFFGNQDYQLEEISLNQENIILLGMGEFRETQQFVEKYILQKGVAPHVNLDPQIELDSSEFKTPEASL